ncbi:response regulator [Chitinophagaceae bacterium LWZ2-11]
MVTIGLIEDDPALRSNFETFFKMDEELNILFSVPSIERFLDLKVQEPEGPFIVFLDIGLPGISGLHGISLISKYFTRAHIVILTGESSDETIWDAINKGANGYLLKPFSLNELRKQIDIVRAGGALISPEVAQKLISRINTGPKPKLHQREDLFTPRENEVVGQLLNGFTYKEIAGALSISVTTVNDHLKNIYVKLGVNSKAELISKLLIEKKDLD